MNEIPCWHSLFVKTTHKTARQGFILVINSTNVKQKNGVAGCCWCVAGFGVFTELTYLAGLRPAKLIEGGKKKRRRVKGLFFPFAYPLSKTGRKGRVTTINGSLKYEYALKDHLGNTRIMFSDKNGDGLIQQSSTQETSEVTQENHYYPFGLNMEGTWSNTPSVLDNKYTFNGKEYNDDFGLNWNDYGARFYDAAIARWHSFDPKAEKMLDYSPYNYVLNNPMRYIDPDGMEAKDHILLNNKNQVVGVIPAAGNDRFYRVTPNSDGSHTARYLDQRTRLTVAEESRYPSQLKANNVVENKTLNSNAQGTNDSEVRNLNGTSAATRVTPGVTAGGAGALSGAEKVVGTGEAGKTKDLTTGPAVNETAITLNTPTSSTGGPGFVTNNGLNQLNSENGNGTQINSTDLRLNPGLSLPGSTTTGKWKNCGMVRLTHRKDN